MYEKMQYFFVDFEQFFLEWKLIYEIIFGVRKNYSSQIPVNESISINEIIKIQFRYTNACLSALNVDNRIEDSEVLMHR